MDKLKISPEFDYFNDSQNIRSSYSNKTNSDHYQKLIEGSFSYSNAQKGISLHYGTTTDLKSVMQSNRLPAGLSINLIFEGEISFMLADQKHRFGNFHHKPECSVFVLKKEETFTRYFRQGMQVKKLSIFAEFEWLEKRCKNEYQLEQLNLLFSHHAQVSSLQPSEKILSLANLLVSSDQEKDLATDSVVELKLIKLLIAFIDQLLHPETKPKDKKLSEQKHWDLNLQISHFISQETPGSAISLQEIAYRLNMSVSTLQRRFKSLFGMTVIEYARIERLEKAKKSMINDDLSIGEVAYISGYHHTSNFISAFTKYYEVSPTNYKKQYELES